MELIDSENNILDTNKLYYINYNGTVQTYGCPSMGTYAYVRQGIHEPEPRTEVPTHSSKRSVDPCLSQPSISNTIPSPLNPASPDCPVNHVSPLNTVTTTTETGAETAIKTDNARVKRAKQRIRQQIYVGKIVSST